MFHQVCWIREHGAEVRDTEAPKGGNEKSNTVLQPILSKAQNSNEILNT